MKPIGADIVIQAPAHRVWEVITDFDRYPEWNHFTPRITLANRDFHVGAELDLDCQMSDRSLLHDEHEVILAIDEARFTFCMGTSRTRGRPGITSERWQVCEPLDETRTHFKNREQFSGPLAPLVYLLYAKKLRRAFERYCQDLQERCKKHKGGCVQSCQ